jgi:RPA family protein
MVENIDELMMLLLRCDGKWAAIRTYEEETGASRAEAIQAVDELARKHGIVETRWKASRRVIAIVAALTLVAACVLLAAPS